ncbi:MAG: hypothetical protein AAB776_04265 [Patescibacteria group bacterium]
MIFLKFKLKRLRRESAPDAAFKVALRSRLVGSQQTLAYRASTPAMRYAFATSALILVVFFGTTSYAYASSAVTEGDALYPVKTKIEALEGRLKKSPEAQARFRAKIMNRRMREVVHRLRHDEPLAPRTVAGLAQAMNMSVAELDDLRQDEAGRALIKTEIKLKMIESLTDFRSRVELSDMPEEQKDKLYKLIDFRLRNIERIETTAPLE